MGLPLMAVSAIGASLVDLVRAAEKPSGVVRWAMWSTDDVGAVTDQVYAAIRLHAMPFVQPYTNMTTIIDGLRQRRLDQPRCQQLAVILALTEDTTGAIEALAQYAEPPGQRIFPIHSPQFRAFLRNFVTYFDYNETDLPSTITRHL